MSPANQPPLGRTAPDGMAEPPLALDPAALTPQKRIVWRFYKDLWDHGDTGLIPELLVEDFDFRGSLGPVLKGREEFAEYVRWVSACFGGYTSDILAMVEEGPQVAGKLRFHGIHRAEVFGAPPSGRHVWWNGAPLFTFVGEGEALRVRSLWVLGDVHGLIGRMRGEE